MFSNEVWFWILFNLFVVAMLVIDLGIFHRKAHSIGFREALITSAAWVLLAALFAVGVYFWRGRVMALEFVTGYIVEESLSVDNLFVFLLIFRYFAVPAKYQHKVLFWGILGAVVMRAVFILAGLSLMARFHWIMYLFGAWLVYTGIHLLFEGESDLKPDENFVVRWCRRWMPLTSEDVDGKFFVRRDRIYATPLFVVLLVVDVMDIMFATDSIPAILAISRNPFIVYTSNVFAILGLRAMYFALAGMMEMFSYLNYGLCAILVLIGAKMLISDYYTIPTWVALSAVAVLLGASVVISVLFPPADKDGGAEAEAGGA